MDTKIQSMKYMPKIIGGDMFCNRVLISDPHEYRYIFLSTIGGRIYADLWIEEFLNKYKNDKSSILKAWHLLSSMENESLNRHWPNQDPD